MCIYYMDDNDLTYCKQEHVFPAALGGIKKLAHGVVSDKANEYFSKLERKAIKESLIQLPRSIIGPGKRGSLSEKKASSSEICIIDVNNCKRLGYIKLGKPCLVEQIILSNNKLHFESEDGNPHDLSYIIIYSEKIINLLDKLTPKLINLNSSTNETIIACYDNKIFIATDGNINIKDITSQLELLKNGVIERRDLSISNEQTAYMDIKEDIVCVKKVIAKISINVLAYVKGVSFVNSKAFNTLKKAVLSDGDEIDDMVCSMKKSIKNEINIKGNMHYCVFLSQGGFFTAIVCLYNYSWIVKFCKLDDLDSSCVYMLMSTPLEGLICDWEKRVEEYNLLEYYKMIGILK